MQATDVRQSSERVPMLPLHTTSGKSNLFSELSLMMLQKSCAYILERKLLHVLCFMSYVRNVL